MNRRPHELPVIIMMATMQRSSTVFSQACRLSEKQNFVVCPAAIRRELIWDTHKQAHTGVQRVFAMLSLRWYWPRMGRDKRLKVGQCEICQASKPVSLVKRDSGGYMLAGPGKW